MRCESQSERRSYLAFSPLEDPLSFDLMMAVQQAEVQLGCILELVCLKGFTVGFGPCFVNKVVFVRLLPVLIIEHQNEYVF